MAGDHLSARQRNGEWWAQHSLSNTDDMKFPDTTGPSTELGSSRPINLPRCGAAGMPLVDRRVRLYTRGGAPDVSKGVSLECVYASVASNFNFFGGVWVRDICAITGGYAYALSIRLEPFNNQIGDTQGRAMAYVGDIGGEWPSTVVYENKIVINDGQPHHLAVRWPPGSHDTFLYVDGVLAMQRNYGDRVAANFEPDSVYASVDAFFTHCDGRVSHLCAGPVKSEAEIKARARFVHGLPERGQVMGWNGGSSWVPVKGFGGATWKEVKAL